MSTQRSALAFTPVAVTVAAAESATMLLLAWQILAYADDVRPARRGG